MKKRTIVYTVLSSRIDGTSPTSLDYLRQTVERRGDLVVAIFADYGAEVRLRQRNVGWKSALAALDGIDQVAVMSAADLPGKTVEDLLRLLDHLRDHGVGLFLVTEGIETGSSYANGVLDIIKAYRAAKLSRAIKIGQGRAVAAGKIIGRQSISNDRKARILASLANGGGIRPTARKFRVSPGSVINVKRSLTVSPFIEAA